MKKLFSSLIAILALGIASMTVASAQSIPGLYKADNGKTFNISDARQVKGVVGSILVDRNTLPTKTYTDGTGAVYQAIIANPDFLKNFVQVGATTIWVNVNATAEIGCTGNKSYAAWNAGGETAYVDNCALAGAVSTRTNN